VHLSTQANTVNWACAKFWQQAGIARIILSRELSIKEISEIRAEVSDLELETFVHGAICVAYSGRCLLSNYFTYRDPNQGTCANSCRWEYKLSQQDMDAVDQYPPLKGNYTIEEHDRPGELLPIDEDEHGTYIMNSKDLCAIGLLDKLINAGVNSFKIEGRTKSVYYLSIITRAYRHAIDDYYSGKSLDQKWKREVNAVANREYITGFLEKNPRHQGENYPNTHKNNQTHLFCGKVVKIEKSTGRILVSVRNRFEQGDELEVVSPDDQFSIRVDRIYSVTGEPLQVAHGGGENIYLDIPDLYNEYSIIRKPVRENDS
jgi:putative protease